MAKTKMSVTEIDTLTNYVAGILYEEQKAVAIKKADNCTKKQYDARIAELTKVREEYDRARKAMEQASKDNDANPLRLNGKSPFINTYYCNGEVGETKLNDSTLFGECDHRSKIADKVKTKIVLRNISGEADIDAIINEMREVFAGRE